MRPPILASTAFVLSLLACDDKDTKPAEETAGAKAETPAKDAPSDDVAPDEVDLEAAKKAFGCDDPADDASKRACKALDAFGGGQAVSRFPSEGTAAHLARSECTKDPHGMINFAVAKLSADGGIETQFAAWPREPTKELTAERIMGDVERGGPPSEPSAEESADGYAPKTLAQMRESWAVVPAIKLELEPVGKSLRELPERPGAGEAFWRQTNEHLVRLAPPSGKFGWCVNLYYPLPDAK